MPVTSMQLFQRRVLAGGKAFGPAGPYELLAGTVALTVDPEHIANSAIVDLSLAKRAEDGRVHFDADFALMQPVDPQRGNGRLLIDVPNRGGKTVLTTFNRAAAESSGELEPDLGDGFLMRQGYTIAWCGWQHDVLDGPSRLSFRAPEALHEGSSLTGPIMCEFQTAQATKVLPVCDPGFRPYPADDLADPTAALSVRGHLEAPARVIPRDRWQFARLEGGSVVPDPTSVYLSDGFEAGRLYELVYTARGAPVVGSGLLAVRDFVAWLRYAPSESANPCAGSLRYAYGFGASQSAHFLRHFLYLGLNEDEVARRIFDGVLALIGSARRGEFNLRFGQPAKTLGQYVGALFPFSDTVQTYPVSCETDGLLARLAACGKEPKIVVLDSSAEYWSRQASLIHTNVEATRDIPIPDSTRIYHMTGTQHGTGVLPLGDMSGPTRVRQALNSVDYRPLVRGGLINLDRWVTEGQTPPLSRYPRLEDRTVASQESVLAFFALIPDAHVPLHVPPLPRWDFGRTTGEGVLETLPPVARAPYASLVPGLDSDGNEISGVRLPDVSVPLATYTGWNVRHPDSGAPDEWLLRAGATLPFPPTAAERQRIGDPRPAIGERYATKKEYLEQVRQAAEDLVAACFVLDEDVEVIVARASLRWDLFTSPAKDLASGIQEEGLPVSQ